MLRIVLRILGVVVVLGVVLVVVLWTVATTTEETTTQERSIPAGEIDVLDLQAVAGAITIVVEDRPDVVVTSRLTSGLLDRASSEVDVTAGTLAVSSRCERRGVFSECRVDHELVVPPGELTSMRVSTTAGPIEVRSFDGQVEIDATAGEIELLDFKGPSATLQSTAARIVVDAVAPPRSLEVSTTAGEIDITVPDEVYRVSTDTTVGTIEVDVRTEPGSDRSIAAETTAGDITIRRR